MSDKKFMSYENALAILTEYAASIGKAGEYRILSQAEYDALTPEEKADTSVEYFIYDAPTPGSVSNLSELKDVQLTNPQNGQCLRYNSATGKWVNSTITAANISELLIDYDPSMAGATVTLTHTASAEGHTAESYTFIADSSGETEIDVKNLGIWTITEDMWGTTTTVDIHYFGYYHIEITPKIYGYHISGSESDPASIIDYHVKYNGRNVDNYDYTPAHVDQTTGVMDHGDWNLTDDFFIPRSCMLGFDGKVRYYLNEYNELLKEDGTASDVADPTYDGNAMMEWGRNGKKIWIKRVADSGSTKAGTVYISDNQLDSDFKCYSFYDANGNQIDHFYTPKYDGSSINGKLRSISGQTPCNTQTGATEVSLATANNQNGAVEWYTEVIVDRMLINDLLYLIGKSTNTQAVFGQGYTTGGSAASSLHASGHANGKGQWYGTSNTSVGVKVFGMEDWWGNIWRRIAGWLNVSGTQKIKQTWSTVDGSTQTGYDATGTGYKTISGATPGGSSGGYISDWVFDESGLIPKTASGSETTFLADGLWFNNGQTNYALVGGSCSDGSQCGAACAVLYNAFSIASWSNGAALSCKPLAE